MPRRGRGNVFRRMPEDSQAHSLIELDRLKSRIGHGLCAARDVLTDSESVFLLGSGTDANGELTVLPRDGAAEME
jgi:hypothetical protein